MTDQHRYFKIKLGAYSRALPHLKEVWDEIEEQMDDIIEQERQMIDVGTCYYQALGSGGYRKVTVEVVNFKDIPNDETIAEYEL